MGEIRWREKDKQLLKKKVRNYNSKINRLIKKNYDIELIPEKMNYKELTKNIKNRSQFNDTIKIVNAMTKRGSEEKVKSNRGLTLPRFTINKIKTEVRAINRARQKTKKKYENLQPTDRGQKLDEGMKEYRDMNVNKIRDKKFNFKNMSRKDFDFFKKTMGEYNIDTSKKDNQYRQNYYKSLRNNLTDEQYKKIVNVLNNLPTDVLVEKFYTDLNVNIGFNYDEFQQETKYKEIIKAWKRISKTRKMKRKERKEGN